MTNEFRYLMRLVSASARGDWAEVLDEKVDWKTVEKLASDQSVQFLLGYSLKKMPKCSCPDEIRHRLIQQMRSVSMLNHTCMNETALLMNDMEAAGIHNVMFKGWSVARYYAAPEARVSGDVDIWVSPKDEKQALCFLESRGFTVDKRWKNGHHSECHHPVLGNLDLHVLFYDEIVESVWFNKTDGQEFVVEPHLKVEDSIGTYYTLNYTDHLLYLILHMVKHFIETGLSLRIILDIAVYYSINKDQVDIQRIWNVVNYLKYADLVNCVLWTAIRYCGFSVDDFPGISAVANEQIQMILDDLEAGGWLGIHDKAAREEGWHEYNRQVMLSKMSPLEYKLRILFWQHGSLQHFFPDKNEMLKQYPWLGERMWLLPLAWVYRLIFRGTKRVIDGSVTKHIVFEKTKISENGEKRVEIFKALKML